MTKKKNFDEKKIPTAKKYLQWALAELDWVELRGKNGGFGRYFYFNNGQKGPE